MRGSSPRQKEQKGSSGFSARAPASPGPLADAGGSYTSSTSQSAQRVNPCRYSALHCGQYIARPALSSPRGYFSLELARTHYIYVLSPFNSLTIVSNSAVRQTL